MLSKLQNTYKAEKVQMQKLDTVKKIDYATINLEWKFKLLDHLIDWHFIEAYSFEIASWYKVCRFINLNLNG